MRHSAIPFFVLVASALPAHAERPKKVELQVTVRHKVRPHLFSRGWCQAECGVESIGVSADGVVQRNDEPFTSKTVAGVAGARLGFYVQHRAVGVDLWSRTLRGASLTGGARIHWPSMVVVTTRSLRLPLMEPSNAKRVALEHLFRKAGLAERSIGPALWLALRPLPVAGILPNHFGFAHTITPGEETFEFSIPLPFRANVNFLDHQTLSNHAWLFSLFARPRE